ncbi:MAG: RNA methyltransferase [Bacteroidales bacterium]|nr:RNA methyltransferase [Bacteroidales bacterium]
MDQLMLDLIEHMSGCVTENRLVLFKKALAERTRYITVLLEDIYQSQNASAVLRTCDCTGIQDVHIVEERNEYEINRDVALGADRWLSLHYYNEGSDNICRCIESLKREGYRIVATSPHKEGSAPENFDLEKGKAALMFGTELNGLTERALELADEHIRIPMVGFTESYNISVSAAITLYTLRKRLEVSSLEWKIAEEEQSELLLNWLRTTIKMSGEIENKFIKGYHSDF